MNFTRFRTSLTVSLFAFASTALLAEPTPNMSPSIPEEDIPVEIIPKVNTTLSFGMRRTTSGPKVKFGNLGTIPQSSLVYSDGSRTYSNGQINADSLYTTEKKSSDGTQILATDGSKVANSDNSDSYPSTTTVDSSGVVTVYNTVYDKDGNAHTNVATSKYRAYKDGQTRSWSYADTSQIDTTNRTVAMSTYGAESTGGEAEADSSSGKGFDLQLEYTIGRWGKRLEWGIAAGFGLTDFNAKTTGTVVSRLLSTTDYYSLIEGLSGGTTYPAYSQPGDGTDLNLVDGNGDTVTVYGSDGTTEFTYYSGADVSNATALNTTATSTDVDTSNGRTVVINGFWQLKGAYYIVRLGPSFRFRISEKFALSGSAGFAGAYVSSTFRANEEISLDLNDIAITTPVLVQDKNTTQKFLSGYYADLKAEYWMTERTGFYAGWGVQEFGGFTQKRLGGTVNVSGRTAKMDIGSSSTTTFGIMTRF